jgi:large subunit ribosomal protein L25
MIILEAETRDKSVDLNSLRKGGKIPAVFYGKKTESTPISLQMNAFVSAWRKMGESGVISIKTSKGTVDTLIHDVQLDPVTDMPVHVDFYVFEKGKKVEVDVPLEFVGVSPAVKDLGGNLVKALQELKISSDPQSIPHEIAVDISSLVDFDSKIIASDIKLPAGVALVENPEEVVAAIVRQKEESDEPSAPIDLSSIEVEKKGKKEEEGESAE